MMLEATPHSNDTNISLSTSHLYNLYDSQLREVLLEQDRIRRTTRNTLLRRMAVIILGLSTLLVVSLPLFVTNLQGILSLGGDGPGALSTSAVMLFGYFLLGPGLILVVPSAVGLCVKTYQHALNTFRQGFKDSVTNKLIAHINEDMTFAAKGYVSQRKFTASQLFERITEQVPISRYRGARYLQGTLEDLPIELSEVTVELATSSQKKRSILFEGIFMVLENPQPAYARILIYPRLMASLLTPLVGHFDDYQRARLEDPVFERHFDVYTDDQVGVRQQLTPRVMENLMALRARVKHIPYISFQDRHVYMALPQQHKHSDVSLFKSVLGPEVVRGLVKELEEVLSLPRVLQADVTSSTLSKSHEHQ